MFWAYMLRCADGNSYTGHTDDLEKRVAAHGSGEIRGYTSERLRVELVWSQDFPERHEAIAAELRIKGWSRVKKEALVRGDWASIQRLAKRRGPFEKKPQPAASPSPQDERMESITPVRPEEPSTQSEASRRTKQDPIP